MFFKRLGEAKESANKEIYVSPINIGNTHEFKSQREEKNNENPTKIVEQVNVIKYNDSYDSADNGRDDGDKITILEKCSEYLFDLFDANLTSEYKKIDIIQEKAIKSFTISLKESNNSSFTTGNGNMIEYTFEQQDLYNEFKDVFEVLINDFLYDERISVEEFHINLQKYIKTSANNDDNNDGNKNNHNSNNSSIIENEKIKDIKDVKENALKNLKNQNQHQGKQSDLANEILDCIIFYTDFTTWANSMRDEAKYRQRKVNSSMKHLNRNLNEVNEDKYLDITDHFTDHYNTNNNDDDKNNDNSMKNYFKNTERIDSSISISDRTDMDHDDNDDMNDNKKINYKNIKTSLDHRFAEELI